MGHPVAPQQGAVHSTVKQKLPSGEELNIRGMERDDLPQLGKIYADVYTQMNVEETWTPTTATQMLENIDDKNPALSIVAEVEGELVGAIFGDVKQWQGKTVLEGREIFVDPAFQKKGIGAELMRELFKKAKVFYRATEIEGVTFANVGHAKEWYKELGYKDVNGLKIISGELDEISANLKPRNSSEQKG